MATHRRGSRPSQWPVRDLLGEQRSRMSELWDPRAAAAVAGLLACGAAVTVAFTVGDAGAGRTDVSALDPAATSPTPPAPPALPVPAFPPGPAIEPPAVPSPPDPATPRAWRPPAADQPAAAPAHRRSRSVQEITDRLASELAAAQDGRLGGVLVMPVQREADATALVTATERASHRAMKKARGDARSHAAASDGEGKQEHERRADRDDDSDRDAHAGRDRHEDEHDRDEHHDRAHCADGQHDRKHHDRKHHEHKHPQHKHHDGQRDRAHEDKHEDDKHHDEKHEHDDQQDHAWGAAEWFGDDAEQQDGGQATASADAASDEPAMAVLVTRSHDGSDSDLTTHRLDSRALLTVLDDLEAADGAAHGGAAHGGAAHGGAVPHARGA